MEGLSKNATAGLSAEGDMGTIVVMATDTRSWY
ncbi:hypothetical protein E9228_000832 [Curtobacterium flaccumfaciens]|uniref:Uncharacterized protein n=1 Tax=Curtobacterium salicis TaxID=1779862 RepID=A0ABX0T7Q1_9MICO|nr:hypothetical protein [Curtobacterium sp. WW7]